MRGAASGGDQSLRDIINEALEPGVFGSQPAPRLDPWIENSGNGKVLRDMCEDLGYGTVLCHVAALWRQRSIERGIEGSEHTIAACRSVRESWIRRAKKAMQEGSDG